MRNFVPHGGGATPVSGSSLAGACDRIRRATDDRCRTSAPRARRRLARALRRRVRCFWPRSRSGSIRTPSGWRSRAALETRARLILANMLWLPAYPATLMLAREHATLPHEEDLEAVRATAQRAAALRDPDRAAAHLEPPAAGGARRADSRARPGSRGAGTRPAPDPALVAAAGRPPGAPARPTAWSGSPRTARVRPDLRARSGDLLALVRAVRDLAQGPEPAACRTAAARHRGGRDARPRRSTARGHRRRGRRPPGIRRGPARRRAAAGRCARRTPGRPGRSRWPAKCAAKCSWSEASTLTP